MKSNNGRKKKKNMTLREWAVKESPPAYLVLLLNGKLGRNDENDEYISRIFCNHWQKAKNFIEKANAEKGKHSLDDFVIEYPDEEVSDALTIGFINLLNNIDINLLNAKRYKELVDFCKDMLELFENDEDTKSEWIGRMGDGLWEQDPVAGEKHFRDHLTQRNDIIMGYYSFQLLNAKRWNDAAEALKGYEDSEDEAIQERFEWLNERE